MHGSAGRTGPSPFEGRLNARWYGLAINRRQVRAYLVCTLLAVLIRCDVLPVVAYFELHDNVAFARHASLVATKLKSPTHWITDCLRILSRYFKVDRLIARLMCFDYCRRLSGVKRNSSSRFVKVGPRIMSIRRLRPRPSTFLVHFNSTTSKALFLVVLIAVVPVKFNGEEHDCITVEVT